MKYKYITDSVHGGITIDDKLIYLLTETREFKRLGRINHLGVSDFIYPSATHTRLAHSYGVYWLSKLILDELKPNISLSTKRAFMAAALLHDIGHGPFSHNFEEISSTRHEVFTKKIITNSSTEIFKVFKENDKNAHKETIKMLEGKHSLMWANQLISSEIDIDRLDYLMRDSIHSGTTYGLIDWKWLIRNMIIMDNKLAFKQKALPTVESVLIARFQMNESIYHNYKNEANTLIMFFFINRLKQLYKLNKLSNTYEEILSILSNRDISIDEFQFLDDSSLLTVVKKGLKEKDEILNKLAIYFLDRKKPELIWENVDEWEKQQDKKMKGILWITKIIKEGWNFYKKNSIEEVYILTLDKKLIKASTISYILNELGNQKQLHKENKIGVKIK